MRVQTERGVLEDPVDSQTQGDLYSGTEFV